VSESTCCAVDGCAQPARSRGWCRKHYHRWYRHGDVGVVRPGGNRTVTTGVFTCARQGCGQSFVKRPSEPKRFCGRDCASADLVEVRDVRTCLREGCDQTFTARIKDPRVFCGKPCARVGAKVARTCARAGCGRPFEVRYSSTRVFCGRRCYYRDAGTVTRCCAFEGCGRVFAIVPSESRQFCSRDCVAASRVGSGPGRATWICEICGSEFVANRGGGQPTCSYECGARYRISRKPLDPNSLAQIVAYRDVDGMRKWLTARTERVSGCWVWQGFKTPSGYAQAGQNRAVHRVVYQVIHGHIPTGDHIHHKCANRACVNPDHLELTTVRQNVGEMLSRQAYIARLSEADEIYAALLDSGVDLGDLRGRIEAAISAETLVASL
jgi:hypothetical protein